MDNRYNLAKQALQEIVRRSNLAEPDALAYLELREIAQVAVNALATMEPQAPDDPYDPFNGDREAFYNDRAARMP